VIISDRAAGPDANNCGCAPPDVQIAAGPDQEVEMVNLAYQVFDRNGSSVHSGSLATFFSSGSDFLSDPKVLYDNLSGRWLASILDFGSSGYILLAVSTTSDALGTWTVYRIPAPPGRFTDQPILGVSAQAIGLSGDVFDASSSTYYGSELWVVNKSDALAGANLSYASFGPAATEYSVHAVQSVSVAGTLYFAMTSYGGSTSAIEVIAASGVPPAPVSLTESNLTVGSITQAPSAPQPSTSSTINPGDPRIEDAIWRSNLLWVTFSDACQPPTDSSARGCARFVVIDTANDTVRQDLEVGLPGGGLFYPAFSVADDGRVSFVVGASSPTLYPSVLASGWGAGSLGGAPEPARFVANGTQSIACGGDCRYGDYFGAAQSPGSDGAWVAGQYLTSTSVAWETRIGLVRILGPSAVRLSVDPPSVDAGQSANVTIGFSSAVCTSETGFGCSVEVPLPSGSFQLPCGSALASATVAVQFGASGNYSIGAGGYLDVYGSPDCSPSSLLANVSITPVIVSVSPAPSVSVTSSRPAVADVGDEVTFTALVVGGVAPFSFAWTVLPTGCSDSGAAVAVCNATAAGSLSVTVEVDDGHGDHVRGTLAYLVNERPEVALTLDRTRLDAGTPVFFTAVATGGTGGYDYIWQGLPLGCSSDDAPALGCIPTVDGNFSVTVTATDGFGVSATSTPRSIVVLPPLTVSVTASPGTPVIGGTLVLIAVASGGAGPLSFQWTGIPPGCSTANASTLSCSPVAMGAYSVRVTVADTFGVSSSASVNVTVDERPAPGLGGWSGSGGLWLAIPIVLGLAILVVAALWFRQRRILARRNPRADEPIRGGRDGDRR
jgi:hypothetical protein